MLILLELNLVFRGDFVILDLQPQKLPEHMPKWSNEIGEKVDVQPI